MTDFRSTFSKIMPSAIFAATLAIGVTPTGAVAMGISGDLTPNLQFPPKGAFDNANSSRCFLFFCPSDGAVTRDQTSTETTQSGDLK